MPARYRPIEDYGVIGDLYTVALVGRNGSIDFMCAPDFDSPTIFAALLDAERGGHFRISPVSEDHAERQIYLPETNVLLTRFLSEGSVAEIVDFMPIERSAPVHDLVREVRAVRGDAHLRMVCAPRFDYGRATHKVERRDGHVLFTSDGPDRTALRLWHDVPVELRDGDVVADLRLRAGETAELTLEIVGGTDAAVRANSPDASAQRFEETRNYWRRWIGRCQYRGRWRETVHRSALALKLLTSERHGSIVAAPTFGLPEHVGGARNWDYRYTWIRDSSFVLYALMRLGYTDESRAFMRWLEDRCRGSAPDGSIRIMYGLDGREDLPETVLDGLEGYRGSTPVRIGNAAAGQLQLDIYGELLDTIYIYNKLGEPIGYDLWQSTTKLVEFVCANWRQADEGIWEVRGGRREFLYSRLMCWVAVDRAVRLATRRSFPAPVDRWTQTRDEIFRDIFERFWDAKLGAFVMFPGSGTLDAASLLMPLVKLVSPTDPSWLSTLSVIERELVDDSLVYRYKAPDGLPGGEGTFSMCSFWYAECLARAGRLDQARLVFEKMLGYASPLGLYAEQLGPRAQHLGNYPQAFTHLGLISAAFALDRALDQAGWRA